MKTKTYRLEQPIYDEETLYINWTFHEFELKHFNGNSSILNFLLKQMHKSTYVDLKHESFSYRGLGEEDDRILQELIDLSFNFLSQ